MGFADAQARLNAAKYRHLSYPATWNGTAVDVRVTTEDKNIGFGHDQAVARATFLEISAATLISPAEGDTVYVAALSATYTVIGQPHLINDGRDWRCEADSAA